MNTCYTKAIFLRFPVFQKGGRPIIDDRNRTVLENFIGEVQQVYLRRLDLLKSSLWSKITEVIRIWFGQKVSATEVMEKLGRIDCQTLIFASHSTYGFLLYKIKCTVPDACIITFFHNIESAVCWENFRKSRRWYDLRNYWICWLTEKLTVRCSDKIIVLNKRDKELLSAVYHYHQAYLLPTSLEDRYQVKRKKTQEGHSRLNLLFVGTYFLANEEGIKWMIKHIVPYVEADFYIVGAGMDKLSPAVASLKNVFITGEVDASTLDNFYYQADVFISTLFMGGGMKTKVAEAMMFGLPVVGTKETFTGYEDDIEQIGYCSNSPGEIITFLKKISKEPLLLKKYAGNARETFIRKYSFTSAMEQMKKILMEEEEVDG